MGKLFTNLKKRVAILTILCMMLTLAPSTAFAATASDITGHWAQNTIQAWIDQGTIKGYPDGTFRPENNISRAE
ncbi:MAG: S-layer homology domain-containing protein, partial [Peptostreptococcaceae bacterium]|nr:S-layer homology domain-containing protein [Peptostreptococcaceae bacterium]